MIRITAGSLILAACFASAVTATPQRSNVQFDVTAIVAFADSTTAEFANAYPGEKTVKAQIVVSLFVPPSVHVSHALYHFYFPEGPARITDYAPRTRVVSDVIGQIDVAESAEQGNHMSLSGGARLESWLNADAAAGRNQSSATTTRYKRQPPVETVLAAGTSNRERGVYFKLRQASTETLEGAQRVEIELRVPEYWRGGYMRLVAQANGPRHVFQASSFLVPVYLQGDRDAQQVARQLIALERYFLRAAEEDAEDIRHAGRPTMAHEMALISPKIPEDWQDQLLWRTTGQYPPSFVQRLPKRVRRAASDFHTAKRLALALGEPPRPMPSPDDAITRHQESDAIESASHWRPRLPHQSVFAASTAGQTVKSDK